MFMWDRWIGAMGQWGAAPSRGARWNARARMRDPMAHGAIGSSPALRHDSW